jgi:Dienelactone hydrolase and related enzymes
MAGALGSGIFDLSGYRNTHTDMINPSTKSIIGNYGAWATSLRPSPGTLSFRRPAWKDLSTWKEKAMAKTTELMASPDIGAIPSVRTEKRYVFDGLAIEELSWQLPYGHRTRAVVMKPENAVGRLPGILALHDHGGKKYFGLDKITRLTGAQHPLMVDHQRSDYEGQAWANEIARRGYVVLVHDAFTFGSRRVRYEDVEGLPWVPHRGHPNKPDGDVDSEYILEYNQWAAEHEHVMSKSLFSSGTTWPGVFLAEDQAALSILAARDDVDSEKLGCGGLSGGGLRTVYLAGTDARIKCAVCAGFMSTWDDFVLHKSYTHTWMTYVPLLPNYLEFPEILGLRVPLPTLVLNNNQDELYTLAEMKKADGILREVYAKAGVPGHFESVYYDGPHKLDAGMQQKAFDWFGKWLRS